MTRIPLKLLRHYGSFNPGEIAGFAPAVARKLVLAEVAEPIGGAEAATAGTEAVTATATTEAGTAAESVKTAADEAGAPPVQGRK